MEKKNESKQEPQPISQVVVQSQSMDKIVRLPVSVEEFKEELERYVAFKKAIAGPEDQLKIQGNVFLKKSFWRKVNNAFNLSVRVVKEERIEFPETHDIIWDFTCEASATNGRVACGTGSCSIYEKATFREGHFMQIKKVWLKTSSGKSYKGDAKDKDGNFIWELAEPNSWHNARSTAETRAYNRAVSNLVGGGEVSAEEVARDTHPNDYCDEPAEAPMDEQPAQKDPPKQENVKMASDAQCKYIATILTKFKDISGRQEKILNDYDIALFSELTSRQACDVIKELNQELLKEHK